MFFWLREELLSVVYPTCLRSQLALCVVQKSVTAGDAQGKSCCNPVRPLFPFSLLPFLVAANFSSNAECQYFYGNGTVNGICYHLSGGSDGERQMKIDITHDFGDGTL